MTTQINIGDITIHRVVEQEAPFFGALDFFPTLTPELLDENLPWLAAQVHRSRPGKLVLCIQSYIVRTPHHTIMIDSCVGNHKPRPARPFWNMLTSDRYEKNLAAAGFGVGDIDYVMCTHLHIDHVGWNTRLENGRWVPTFPKAKYLFAERELAHWTEQEKKDPANHPWITDSVLPIVAGQARRGGQERPQAQRTGAADPDARPHHRSFLGARRQAGAGRVHHRRHDPLADAGALSRARHARGLRFQAGRCIPAPDARSGSATARP